ncbi:hypothetical protein ACGF5F_30440 [Streptomyces sp. NPDC047821]|uniref:hypothetical protein n=1 Tax=Streptomyces sp. NPDC047821 TaxID=3365488 RepID=UPI003711F52C
MSEETQPKQNQTPEQEQQAADAQIQGTYAFVDMTGRVSDLLDFFGPGAGYVALGNTDFDSPGRKLNDLLDLVESANPADLENAGEALEKATTAINSAARDLSDFVKSTDWEGEGAAAFRTYGQGVVAYAWDIATVANAVGAQMKVASTGLASVRNSMPPRDTRAPADQKDPRQFKPAERTQDNPEYQKALQVEKDRQEAINQMNRLGSYYVVSQSTLAGQELPPPPAAYKAAVPPPAGSKEDSSGGGSGAPAGSLARSSSTISDLGGAGVGESVDRAGMPGRAGSIAPSTAMEIDSVTTVAPPTANPGPTASPPVTAPNQGQGPVPAPQLGNFPPPGRPASPRMGDPRTAGGQPYKATGRAGLPATSQPLGRPATSTGRAPSAPTSGPTSTPAGRSPMGGRPMTPGLPGGGGPGRQAPAPGRGQDPFVGRPTTSGVPGGGGPGRQGPISGRGQDPVVGRPGGPGQSATGHGTTSPGSRTSRGNGIVGGTPQRPGGGSTGARMPRGTVIGADDAAAARPTAARPSQAGVVGANSATPQTRSVGRGTPSANGVVGTPRAAGARPGTAGGGTVGGGGGPRRDDEPGRESTARPARHIEDEETRANHRRGAVPPVIG